MQPSSPHPATPCSAVPVGGARELTRVPAGHTPWRVPQCTRSPPGPGAPGRCPSFRGPSGTENWALPGTGASHFIPFLVPVPFQEAGKVISGGGGSSPHPQVAPSLVPSRSAGQRLVPLQRWPRVLRPGAGQLLGTRAQWHLFPAQISTRCLAQLSPEAPSWSPGGGLASGLWHRVRVLPSRSQKMGQRGWVKMAWKVCRCRTWGSRL